MKPRGLRGTGRLAENELERLMKLPRSEKSLSRLTLRSTPPTKEALLLTSTAPSWGRRPPGPERRVCGGVSIATGAVQIP